MAFYWSLSDNKSPQVSRTLLSILTDLKNAAVWPVYIPTVISKSFSPCINPLVTVPRAPIGITVIFMFYSFFDSLAMSNVLVLIPPFAFFQFYFVIRWDSKFHISACSLFFVDYYVWSSSLGRLAEIMWAVCISKPAWSFYVLFSWIYSGLCIYHLFVWLNFNFLHNS